jgi:hypothetical protein
VTRRVAVLRFFCRRNGTPNGARRYDTLKVMNRHRASALPFGVLFRRLTGLPGKKRHLGKNFLPTAPGQ